MSNNPNKHDVVTSMQYDPKVNRKSLEDPQRHHRRSSIPFADRKPAVRFIRSIDLRKRSIAGPYDPRGQNKSQKPILKKSLHPILVDSTDEAGLRHAGSTTSGGSTTNDEIEQCRYKTELIMDKVSRAERIGRGSMDVLTFPTSTRRVDALSRYQGCMTVCVCTIGLYTSSDEFISKRKKKTKSTSMTEIRSIIDVARDMKKEAQELYRCARKFFSLSKQRYVEWDDLLKRNTEFKIEHCKLRYPLYSNKKMPESVTLFEDALEGPNSKDLPETLDGYLRVCRSYPEAILSLYCDLFEPTEKDVESINFQEGPTETQLEIIKCVTNHGKDLIFSCSSCLKSATEILQEKDMEDSFNLIQQKINSLEYDEYFDPLCALEFKNTLGELDSRKAELLNTAEQILEHCKWILLFTNRFYKFTKRSIKGSNVLRSLCCCDIGTSQRKLLQLLGIVSVEDVTILMPLTVEIAQDVFHLDPLLFSSSEVEKGSGEVIQKQRS